ncbi:hypothetical protein [Phycicoccus flavus]|uniref:hypothetical protein n=1 Tax=Phycicoccus flavus TaxID=2502783 RepID=UPI00197C9790|nr:hypothetical protein [Phycicoccus flavus]
MGRAVRAARVLVVECPGARPARMAAEQAVAARGWRIAQTPASADVLLVVGEVRGGLDEVVDRLWEALPGPRARADVRTEGDAAAALARAAAVLVDGRGQRADAEQRDAAGAGPGDDTGGHDHDDTGGHDHDDMDMAPDGIPLAEGAEQDRDGLEMDALPVRLGPVLPDWPAGLVIDVVLHGDLVVTAAAAAVGGPEHDPVSEPLPEDTATVAAARCDDVAAVLALAGWEEGARAARSARDVLLARRGDDARATLVDLRHRVEHSRWLRWSLAGTGTVTPERARDLGLAEDVVGDCRDRLLVLITRAEAAARRYGASGLDAPVPDVPAVPLTAVGPLLEGCDLGAARLVVASLGSDLVPDPVPQREAAGA